MNAGVLGIGRYVPEKVVTNLDLEKVMDTSDEWIRTRTGIQERRIAADNEDTSDLAYKATVEALHKANVEAEDIDMIIVATVTPDQPFPTVSCIFCKKNWERKKRLLTM